MNKSIFLADDDVDDRILFEDALKEIYSDTILTIATDGEHLMCILNGSRPPMPDIIFLDLNMPRKNGLECVDEIKRNEALKNIPLIIFSTSSDDFTKNRVFATGADYYISKPGSFTELKKIIQLVLSINWEEQDKSLKKKTYSSILNATQTNE